MLQGPLTLRGSSRLSLIAIAGNGFVQEELPRLRSVLNSSLRSVVCRRGSLLIRVSVL